ncbi:MAG: DUF4493 domain-containing protein [Tannerellaceae bacterium]|nr:DUF4493 domain-containing protein [Tannerellaceae bacterium]MCD8263321.1 DUF4493 domain-containing protein [Tannerellaceae bacterium]
MKHTAYIILLLLGWSILGITSCEMQKDILGKNNDKEEGAIHPDSLGGLSLALSPEKEADLPSKSGVASGSDVVVLDMNEFSIQILDEEGEIVKYYDSYKELEEEGTIFLPAGTYYIQAYLGELVEAGFDLPYYEGTNTCVITAKEIASIITNCTLANKKISFTYTDDFLQKFKQDYTIIMTNGTGVLTFGHGETRIPYFKLSDRLEFIIHTTTVEGTDLTYSLNLFEDEEVANHNNIWIDLDIVPDTIPTDPEIPGITDPEPEDPEEVSKPTLVVNISLINREYVIEIPSNFVNPDEGSGGNNSGGDVENPPVITGSGISSPLTLTVAQALAGNTTVSVTILTPNGIKNLYVLMTTSNAGFQADLVDWGLSTEFDMMNLDSELESALSTLGLTKPSHATSNVFDISKFVPMIAGFGAGEYNFRLRAVDQKGGSTTETLKLILTD